MTEVKGIRSEDDVKGLERGDVVNVCLVGTMRYKGPIDNMHLFIGRWDTAVNQRTYSIIVDSRQMSSGHDGELAVAKPYNKRVINRRHKSREVRLTYQHHDTFLREAGL